MSVTLSQLADLQSDIDFSKSLAAEFKQKNKDEEINIMQAMWVNHRFRAWTYTYNLVTYTVSIQQALISGDVQTAYVALISGTPDSMLLPYHWLNQDRIDWLANQMKAHLGL